MVWKTLGVFLMGLSIVTGQEAQTEAERAFSQLRQKFVIKEGVLINQHGEEFPEILFEDKLDEDLHYMLKDPKQARVIHNAYKRYISPHATFELQDVLRNGAQEDYQYLLKDPKFIQFFEDAHFDTDKKKHAKSTGEAFSKALIEVSHLFGPCHQNLKEIFTNALMHQGPLGMQWVVDHDDEISAFIHMVEKESQKNERKQFKAPFKVVITTTSASGGNYSIAIAIRDYLERFKDIEAIIVDTEEIAKQVEPMMLATGKTYDGLYSGVYQKTNDFNAIFLREDLNRVVQKYIPSQLLTGLKERIREIDPDVIFSTRSYVSDDLSLANLGIPLRFIHADFELSLFLNSYYGKLDPEHIRFWIPDTKAAVFRPFFEWHDRLDDYDPDDTYEEVLTKIASLTGISRKNLKAQFEVIGYPISPHFSPINDRQVINELRNKWGIEEGEIPIFITMGKYGVGSLSQILQELLKTAPEKPYKFLFICGQNPLIKEELDAILAKSARSKKPFSIYGLLSPAEMNEVMNISQMGISKAGGGAVAEALATNTHLLIAYPHPWEYINALRLEEQGLASYFDAKRPLLGQIEECLEKQEGWPPVDHPFPKWQGLLEKYLEDILGCPDLAQL